MRVVATDDGVNPRSTAINVFITILRHPGAPALTPDPCQASISENVAVGYNVLTLRASDPSLAVSWSLKLLSLFVILFCLKIPCTTL